MSRVEIIMPQLGESIAEGTVVKWLKAPGDKVGKDESVLEITTDKVDSEIPSPSAGVLVEIVAPEGTTVGIGKPLGILETDVSAAAGAAKPAKAPEQAAAGAQPAAAAAPAAAKPAKGSPQSAAPAAPPEGAGQREKAPQADGTPAPAEKIDTMPVAENATPTAGGDPTRAAATTARNEPDRPVTGPGPSAPPRPAGGDGGENGGMHRFYSPLVRRIAREEGISLAELERVAGSGEGGRVNKEDVLNYLEERKRSGVTPAAGAGAPRSQPLPVAPGGIQHQPQFMPAAPQFMPAYTMPQPGAAQKAGPPPVPPAYRVPRQAGEKETRIPFDNIRKKIAEHMVRSKMTSPHVTSCSEADVTNIVNFREAMKGAFEATQGVKLTYTPFFVQAVVRAIQDFPMVNASVDEETLVVKHSINLGLAVALDDGGLIVPVIKNAEEKNFIGLARAADDLGRRAKAKKLVPDEVSGGTFSITNPGVFGGLWGTPIINQPQVAIFGMGAIQKRPVVINNMIAIRDMIYITLSYDHRVVDGALSVQFLERVAWYLENFDPTGQIPGVS